MRVALVVHAFPPSGTHGVENHTEAFARALVAAGCSVEVLAPRTLEGFARGSQRREERDGFGVTWLQVEPSSSERECVDALRGFLERERPEVVHFQHLLGFGPDALRVPGELGMACVHTAHDFHPAHETWTLMRPDLVPFACGDDEAQARTLRAQGLLDKIPALGDHHGTVLPGQLPEAAAATLAAILSGERDEGLEEARARVRLRSQRFRDAFARADARLATSRALALDLTAALGRAVEVQPSGVDTARFAQLDPPRDPASGAPLRIGFLGGLLKHKGVHVLLDAFAGLQVPAELHLHGSSHDRAYTRWVRARAAEVGAVVHGGYRQAELPALLRGLDVVCVPSLWVENAPYVIREAQAAGRVLVVSDTAPLRESFAEGEGGLFAPPGDVAAWSQALTRLATEEGLFERLRSSVRRPLDLGEEARAHLTLYGRVLEARASQRPRPVVPASVEPLRARLEELQGLPTRDLFDRVLAGLGRLARCMGAEEEPTALLGQVVGAGSPTRDRVLDHGREIRWLRETLRAVESERDEQARRADWLADQAAESERRAAWVEQRIEEGSQAEGLERDWLRETLKDLEQERDWLKAQHEEAEGTRAWLRESLEGLTREAQWLRERDAAREVELDTLRTERDWLRGEEEALRGETAWLRDDAEALRREGAWLRGRVEAAEGEVDRLRVERAEVERAFEVLREERDWLQGLVATRQDELRWLREQLTGEVAPEDADPSQDGAAIQAATEALRGELEAVRRHAAWLHAEVAALAAASRGEQVGSATTPGPDAVAGQLQVLRAALARARAELGWRRSEMAAARESADRLLARLAVPGLAERLSTWTEQPAAAEGGEGAPPSPEAAQDTPQEDSPR